jgi:NADPH:quinone reductase-like Zn-dependent oxidoreductase
VRTAQIIELGRPPELADTEAPADPEGIVLTVHAVAFNPVDVAIANGRFYAGHPPLPYTPGIEAVGTVGDRLVYAQGSGRGIARDGFATERVTVDEADLIELPDGVDAALAVALGTAGVAGWLSTTARAAVGPDDRVVVLGATGAVGTIAVQAARHRGAARVVAVGRDRTRLAEITAVDAAVTLADGFVDEVVAASGGPPTVVIDTLWGEAVAALLPALAPGARVVNVGASAGPESALPSAAVRGKQLAVLGYSNFGVPRAQFVEGYRELVGLAATGEITLPLTTFSLDDVAAAWQAAAGGGTKVVVTVGSS